MPGGRGTTTQRGLGADHQRRRRRLLPLAYGQPCPLCGKPMLRDQALDLDHSVPRSKGGRHGDRITHASCNRSRGNRTGPSLDTSEDWLGDGRPR